MRVECLSAFIFVSNLNVHFDTDAPCSHNCNNFSDAFLRECLSLPGVPPSILDIPRLFVESPMGAMVAPMIQGMYTPFQGEGVGAVSTMPAPPPMAVQPAAAAGLDFSALLSGFPPSTPAAPPPPAADYMAQNEELKMMGFEDEAKNLECLARAGGDLGRAIDYISEGMG